MDTNAITYRYDELSLVNKILTEYYLNSELDYRIIIDNYLDYYLMNNTKKMNKKIIKFYYKSIKNAFKFNKHNIENIYPPIVINSELFKALAFIIVYNKICPIIENELNNNDTSDAETVYDY
jgi:hypothetical protein